MYNRFLGARNPEKDIERLLVDAISTPSLSAVGYQILLTTNASATDTTIDVNQVPTGVIADGFWAIIDPWTVQCEIRKVTAMSGNTLTVAALSFAHSTDDRIIYTTTPIYNVKYYGALGDGSTDDNLAIQACIDDMTDGSSLYFPKGDYSYTVLPAFLTIDNIRVFGEGILKPSACFGLSFDDCQNVIVDGLRIQTTQASNTYIGIRLIGSTGNVRQAVIKNCHLSGFKYGIKLTDSAYTVGNSRIYGNWIELTGSGLSGSIGIWTREPDNKFYDNTIQYYETGITLDAASQLVKGNHIWAPAGASPAADIDIRPGATSRGSGYIIANNYFDGAPSDGHIVLNVQGAGQVAIADNYFRAPDTMTEYIAFVNGGSVTDIQDVTITGNVTVNASGGSVEFLSFTGVQSDDSENFHVYSNSFGSQVTPYSTSFEVRQTPSFTAPFVPNPMLGRMLELTVTANVTINAPTDVYMGGIGNRLTFLIIQDATGGRTIGWVGVYKQGWSDTGNAADKRSSITFEWDGTNFNQISAQSPYV